MIPERVGPYEIFEELGAGGMGTVYLARPLEGAPIDRPRVALKRIHAARVQSAEGLARVRREARVGRGLEHPNLVRLLDAHVAEDGGESYLVMELVEGESLRQVLASHGRLGERLVRHVAREVAAGLAALHAAGVAHRDLKPENVLLTPDDRVCIVDLGLARADRPSQQISQVGQLVGTLAYAAPEALLGVHDVGVAADCFALGTLLHELVAGQHPFTGTTLAVTLDRIRQARAPSLQTLAEPPSPFLDALIRGLHARSVERRLTAGQVCDILAEGELGAWWRERGTTGTAERARWRRSLRSDRPFAGYLEERGALEHCIPREATDLGSAWLIEGSAGLGKSRLIAECLVTLDAGEAKARVLHAQASPGRSPLGLLSRALRSGVTPEGLEAAIGAGLREATDLADRVRRWLMDGEERALPEQARAPAMVALVRALASEEPVFLWIDDAHELAPEGLAILAALEVVTRSHALMLVLSGRPGPSDWVAQIPGRHLELTGITETDIERALEQVLTTPDLAPPLAGRIAARAGGSPAFLWILLEQWQAQGLVNAAEGGRLDVSRGWSQIISGTTPDTLSSLVRARARSIPHSERELLDVGSCLGCRFDPTVLAAVVEEPLLRVLRRLNRLAHDERLLHFEGQRVAFVDPCLRDVLYEALPEPLRRSYHAAIARELERLAEVRPVEGADAVLLTEQWLEAGEVDRALRHEAAAVAHLLRTRSKPAAGALVDRLLAAGPGPDAELRLVVRRTGVVAFAPVDPLPAEVIDRARARAEASGDTGAIAAVALAEGDAHRRAGRIERAIECLQQGVAAADSSSQAATLSVLHALLYGLRRRAEGLAEGLAHMQEAVRFAQASGQNRTYISGLGLLASHLALLGRDEEARAARDELEAVMERGVEDPAPLAEALHGLAVWSYLQGEVEAAEAYSLRSLEIARRWADHPVVGRARGALLTFRSHRGAYAEAHADARQAIELIPLTGQASDAITVWENWAWVNLKLGRREVAHEAAERAEQLAAEVRSPRAQATVARLSAHLHRVDGESASAVRRLAEAIEGFVAFGDRREELHQRVRLEQWQAQLEGRRPSLTLLHQLEDEAHAAKAPSAAVLATAVSVACDAARRDDAAATLRRAGSTVAHLDRMEAALLIYGNAGDPRDRTTALDLFQLAHDRLPQSMRDTYRRRGLVACDVAALM